MPHFQKSSKDGAAKAKANATANESYGQKIIRVHKSYLKGSDEALLLFVIELFFPL